MDLEIQCIVHQILSDRHLGTFSKTKKEKGCSQHTHSLTGMPAPVFIHPTNIIHLKLK